MKRLLFLAILTSTFAQASIYTIPNFAIDTSDFTPYSNPKVTTTGTKTSLDGKCTLYAGKNRSDAIFSIGVGDLNSKHGSFQGFDVLSTENGSLKVSNGVNPSKCKVSVTESENGDKTAKSICKDSWTWVEKLEITVDKTNKIQSLKASGRYSVTTYPFNINIPVFFRTEADCQF